MAIETIYSTDAASLDQELNRGLAELRSIGLGRSLRCLDSGQAPRVVLDGRELINFSSNDYLGLAGSAELKAAMIEAIGRYGCGAGASRLVCGSLHPHHELEERLADFKETEAAISFATGYSAALGTICALVGKDDFIVMDRLVHASIVDAARLSGAKLRVLAHNDLEELEDILTWVDERRSGLPGSARRARVLLITESIFSMDGDRASLRQIVELKDRFGAWLMLDEAHATGVLGRGGRGLANAEGVSDRIEIQMGTLGKACGVSGGFICGSRALVDWLINRARSFIFSTAPPPAVAAAATAAVGLVGSDKGDECRRQLWQRITEFQAEAVSPILPIMIGRADAATDAAESLARRGFLVPAIRYPSVARGKARLRVTLSAAHSTEEVLQFKNELHELGLLAKT
jgi:8-amino-7-oxononanoate synthase